MGSFHCYLSKITKHIHKNLRKCVILEEHLLIFSGTPAESLQLPPPQATRRLILWSWSGSWTHPSTQMPSRTSPKHLAPSTPFISIPPSLVFQGTRIRLLASEGRQAARNLLTKTQVCFALYSRYERAICAGLLKGCKLLATTWYQFTCMSLRHVDDGFIRAA